MLMIPRGRRYAKPNSTRLVFPWYTARKVYPAHHRWHAINISYTVIGYLFLTLSLSTGMSSPFLVVGVHTKMFCKKCLSRSFQQHTRGLTSSSRHWSRSTSRAQDPSKPIQQSQFVLTRSFLLSSPSSHTQKYSSLSTTNMAVNDPKSFALSEIFNVKDKVCSPPVICHI